MFNFFNWTGKPSLLKRNQIFDYQEKAIQFIKERGNVLLHMNIGRGKSATFATACAEGFKGMRVLVVAPPQVAINTWPAEYKEWKHLKHLWCEAAVGTSDQRRAVIDGPAPVVSLSYQNLAWLFEGAYARKLKDPSKRKSTFKGYGNRHGFDLIIFDEVQHLARGNTCFKTFRKYRQSFSYIMGCTGTPFTEGLDRVWAYAMAINPTGFPLHFSPFQETYFRKVTQYKWVPMTNTERDLMRLIEPWFYVVDDRHLPMPFRVEHRHYKVRMPEEAMQRYKQMETEQVMDYLAKQEAAEVAKGSETAGELKQIAALSRASLKMKLWQMASGFVYHQDELAGEDERETHWLSEVKFDALYELLEELKNEQVVIVYWFKAQLELLLDCDWPGLKKGQVMDYVGAGISRKQSETIVKRWNEGKIPRLAIHPASMSEGVNLQKGGAHHMIFLCPFWSGEKLKQMQGRLARTGQIAPVVYFHYLNMEGTTDLEMSQSWNNKLSTEEAVLNAILDRVTAPQ